MIALLEVDSITKTRPRPGQSRTSKYQSGVDLGVKTRRLKGLEGQVEIAKHVFLSRTTIVMRPGLGEARLPKGCAR